MLVQCGSIDRGNRRGCDREGFVCDTLLVRMLMLPLIEHPCRSGQKHAILGCPYNRIRGVGNTPVYQVLFPRD